ncbi:hypothetical protein CMQ_3678 [Grosmannia clavigera kw1407]|uniref:Uncharacterized protein n=1 Tax=Grosmannia clavigera (strain kw1407 / UAMH 11150) TaxID=655863 RepID=F0X872_GROCL|nr:uncharacterized protein CMQ_3678 [Grosmannia clavigera kw1407]EFX05609.1 hypothetical protein CMQ_3678 [Grosmannia clavigera kw1407]
MHGRERRAGSRRRSVAAGPSGMSAAVLRTGRLARLPLCSVGCSAADGVDNSAAWRTRAAEQRKRPPRQDGHSC